MPHGVTDSDSDAPWSFLIDGFVDITAVSVSELLKCPKQCIGWGLLSKILVKLHVSWQGFSNMASEMTGDCGASQSDVRFENLC